MQFSCMFEEKNVGCDKFSGSLGAFNMEFNVNNVAYVTRSTIYLIP